MIRFPRPCVFANLTPSLWGVIVLHRQRQAAVDSTKVAVTVAEEKARALGAAIAALEASKLEVEREVATIMIAQQTDETIATVIFLLLQ